jgi:hypothetical protein
MGADREETRQHECESLKGCDVVVAARHDEAAGRELSFTMCCGPSSILNNRPTMRLTTTYISSSFLVRGKTTIKTKNIVWFQIQLF